MDDAHHGYAGSDEVGQHIEMYVYMPWSGENWMSTALQLVNNNWIPFNVMRKVVVQVCYYHDVQRVDLVLTNSIYNPMSAHRRYELRWENDGGYDGRGNVRVVEQIGTTANTLFFGTSLPKIEGIDIWLLILRESSNKVSFWLGEGWWGQQGWTKLCETSSYILGTNYPDMIFDTYGDLQYDWAYAVFDEFTVID